MEPGRRVEVRRSVPQERGSTEMWAVAEGEVTPVS